MSLILQEKNLNENDLRRHVDYDKKNGTFYNNFYFPDTNYVLKTPLASKERRSLREYKIEKFDLLKYSFLMHY